MRLFAAYGHTMMFCLAFICAAGCSTPTKPMQTVLAPDHLWTWVPCDIEDAQIVAHIKIHGIDLKGTAVKVPLQKQSVEDALAAGHYSQKDWNYSLFTERWDGMHEGGSREITLHRITPLGLHITVRRSRVEETIDTRLIIPYVPCSHKDVGTVSYEAKWTGNEAEQVP